MTLKRNNRSNFAFSLWLINLSIWLLVSNSSFATQKHSHEKIRNAAIEFVRSQIPEGITIKSIKAGKIDSRINFQQCSQALEMSSSNKKYIAKNWTIGVRCSSTPSWNIYIPVKAQLTQKMLLSKTTITRGELLTTQNIKFVEHEITNQNQNYFSNIADVIGREAHRTIRPNRIINASMLQEALMVHKKEAVLIYAKNNHLQISMKGTALKNGRYNQMIKVRNNSSHKVIDAIVIDRGIVAVSF